MGLAPPKHSALWTKRFEALAYALTAGFITLTVALRFYGSLRLQTLYAQHWGDPSAFDKLVLQGRGPWSAPLDDVFIHFDFARATARGFPFQWSEGNGYSSGGTSLSYPFVLALGYLLGFRGLRLMEWAGVIACVSVFACLLGARRLCRELPLLTSYLLPFGLLVVGTLDWTLFSGMEVALFLALWTAAYIAYDDLLRANVAGLTPTRAQIALFAFASSLVTATRPEGISSVLVLTAAAGVALRPRGVRSALAATLPALAAALAVLAAQSLANRVFTGESTAAGALVKLELHHPYLSAREVFDSWLFFVKYQVLRVTQYHFGDQPIYGWIAWLLAAAAFAFRGTRRPACVLMASAALWVALVALNGQVRWQNERYTMPAVYWLLATATLGTGALAARAFELRKRIRGLLIALPTALAVALFAHHQAPRFREQLWFFGRAARNILDQHVRAGLYIREKIEPQPHRVLVGDAGAIPYVSDLPALDIIGLGGYRGLPFARATREHVGAALELIERMAPSERPDLLAIYPGWWGDFPSWFGHPLVEVPVRGNVICGGAAKVLYRPDWAPLDEGSRPFSLRAGERVLDELDPADLVNEREHAHAIVGAPGFVTMELLENPSNHRPLWDAGRVLPPAASEMFELTSDGSARARLIVRSAPSEPQGLEIAAAGQAPAALPLPHTGGWEEASLEVPALARGRVRFRLRATRQATVVYHVFLVAEP